jgi:hypothetical protein
LPGIIWLASYPKSGNTWLRAFLANYLANAATPVPINDLPDHVLGDNLILHYEQLTGKPVRELAGEDLNRLRPKVHEWLACSRPDEVFVKTHSVLRKIGGVPLITPSATAAVVYVVRNPLDVAVSFAHHYQVTYGRAVESLCTEGYVLPPSAGLCRQHLGSWSHHVGSWTEPPGPGPHVLRYEDMLGAPVKAFGGLVRFLGLPKDPARLKRAIDFSSFRELSGQERTTRFVEARPDGKSPFFRAGQTGAWRQVLTEAQAEALIAKHGHVMAKMGYLTQSGKPARGRGRPGHAAGRNPAGEGGVANQPQ